jgi:deazaflavin-dependent oxidoreductase (nitroreductase family)
MSVDSVMSRLNPLIAAVLRSPLHFLLSSGLALITVTGRRSGRRYAIPVGYQREGDGVVVMVSEAKHKQWWRNFYEPAPVALRLRGSDRRGTAELVAPGSDDFRRYTEQTLSRLPWMARVFHVEYEREGGLRTDQLDDLGEEIAIVRIALER